MVIGICNNNVYVKYYLFVYIFISQISRLMGLTKCLLELMNKHTQLKTIITLKMYIVLIKSILKSILKLI